MREFSEVNVGIFFSGGNVDVFQDFDKTVLYPTSNVCITHPTKTKHTINFSQCEQSFCMFEIKANMFPC